jgi:hypothetical protein
VRERAELEFDERGALLGRIRDHPGHHRAQVG